MELTLLLISHQIPFKVVRSNTKNMKNAKSRVRQFQVYYLRITFSCRFKIYIYLCVQIGIYVVHVGTKNVLFLSYVGGVLPKIFSQYRVRLFGLRSSRVLLTMVRYKLGVSPSVRSIEGDFAVFQRFYQHVTL